MAQFRRDVRGAVADGLAVDAIITDYAMPGMNGVQFAEALHAVRLNIPILMISGFANLADKDSRGLPLLSKPFRESELIAKVAELIGSAGNVQRDEMTS